MSKKTQESMDEEAQLYQELISLLDVPPGGLPYQEQDIPLGQLVLDNAVTPSITADVTELAKSIGIIGLLHPPAVEFLSTTDDGPRYQVLAGRRRTLAMQRLGRQTIRCRVYTCPNDYVRGMVRSAENMSRRNDWRDEVRAVAQMVAEGVGVTPRMLFMAGFQPSKINKLLDMALLPAPIVGLITTGKMNEQDARKITRLASTTQRELSILVEEGQELTPAAIKETLAKQQTPTFVVSLPSMTPAAPVSNGNTEPAGVMEGQVEEREREIDLVAELETLLAQIQKVTPSLSLLQSERQLGNLLRAASSVIPVIIRERSALSCAQA